MRHQYAVAAGAGKQRAPTENYGVDSISSDPNSRLPQPGRRRFVVARRTQKRSRCLCACCRLDGIRKYREAASRRRDLQVAAEEGYAVSVRESCGAPGRA